MELSRSEVALREKREYLERILEIPLENCSVLTQEILDRNHPGEIRIPDYNVLVSSRVEKILTLKPTDFGFVQETGDRKMFRITGLKWRRNHTLTPQACHLQRKNYTMGLLLDIEYYTEKNGIPTGTGGRREDHYIGEFPVMTYSESCILYGKSDRELIEYGEDPSRPRGVFIYNGVERYIEAQEQLSTGTMFIYKMKKGEAGVNMTVQTNNGTMVIVLKGNEFAPKNANPDEIQMSLTTLRSKSIDPKKPESSMLNVVRIVRLLHELKKYNTFRDFCYRDFYSHQDWKNNGSFDTFVNKQYEVLMNGYKTGTMTEYYYLIDYHIYSQRPDGYQYDDFDFENYLQFYLDPDAYTKCLSFFRITYNYSFGGTRDDIVFFNGLLSGNRDMSALTIVDAYTNVASIISRDVFPNINDMNDDVSDIHLQPSGNAENDKIDRKIHMVMQAVAIYLEHRKGFRPLHDRDSWSIKRAVGAAALIEQLVRTWLFKCNGNLRSDAKSITNIDELVKPKHLELITHIFTDSFTTAFWGAAGRVKENITHDVPKTSLQEACSALNIVNVNIPRTKNVPRKIRNVQDTQYNAICCVYTPDGDNTGLPKNLSLTAIYSRDRDDSSIIQYLRNINGHQNIWGKNVASLTPVTVNGSYTHKLFVNGKYLGWVVVPIVELYNNLVNMRRKGIIQNDVGIITKSDRITIDTTASRIIYPYFVVNTETNRLVIDEIADREDYEYSFEYFLRHGAVEYISPGEQEYSRVAVYTWQIDETKKNIEKLEGEVAQLEKLIPDSSILEKEKNEIFRVISENTVDSQRPKASLIFSKCNPDIMKGADEYRQALLSLKTAQNNLQNLRNEEKYKYCQIDPQSYLSFISSLIFYLNHNQSPRITFTINMIKQASGCYNTNYANLVDDKIKILMRREAPLVRTETDARDRFHGYYTNVNHAFISYEGNEEDAMIMNRDALLMGKFRLIKTIIHKFKITVKAGKTDQLFGNPNPGAKGYNHITSDGLPYIGAHLRQRDCVIGVLRKKEDGSFTDISVYMNVGEQGIVTNVYKYTNIETQTTNVIVRITAQHIPEKGDKFTVPNAQKDTIGNIRPSYELPYTKDGVVPDTIYNTTCLPSRMTYSFIIILVAATAAAYSGQRKNASPHRKEVGFTTHNLLKYQKEIEERGGNKYLENVLYSPQTSTQLTKSVFMGLCPFISLKHLASQKIQARSRGAIKTGSRQPTKGKKKGGGGRVGEMEKDALVAHGCSFTTRQCLMEQSDLHVRVVCLECNATAITGPVMYSCPNCNNMNQSRFGKCDIPYSFETLQQYLTAACIDLSVTYVTQETIRNKVERRQQRVAMDVIDEEEEEEEEEESEDEGEGIEEEGYNLTGFSDNTF